MFRYRFMMSVSAPPRFILTTTCKTLSGLIISFLLPPYIPHTSSLSFASPYLSYISFGFFFCFPFHIAFAGRRYPAIVLPYQQINLVYNRAGPNHFSHFESVHGGRDCHLRQQATRMPLLP